MDIWQRFIVPATAALVAGAMNAMAGGGSFLSFPALLGARLLPITAKATNVVAMWPGELASVFAFRRELRTRKDGLILIATAGALGGAAGAVALLKNVAGAISLARAVTTALRNRPVCFRRSFEKTP